MTTADEDQRNRSDLGWQDRVHADVRTSMLGFQHICHPWRFPPSAWTKQAPCSAAVRPHSVRAWDLLLCRQATSLVMVEVGPNGDGGRERKRR